jgi:hypothetical protein
MSPSYVHDLVWTPPPRYDSVPWTLARIEESPDNVVFTAIEQVILAPDDDPAHPQQRKLTTVEATLAEGYFRLVALDDDNNESPPSSSVFSPSTADDGYPPLDALLAASSVTELTAALDQEQQAELRAAAIADVEDYCRQPFVAEGTEAEPVAKLLDGAGGNTLWLPKRLAPGFELSITGSWLTASEVELSAERDRLSITSLGGGATWLTRELRRMQVGEAPAEFPTGPGLVTVTGAWGWSADEWNAGELDAVETAIRFAMEDQALADATQLAPTVRSARALGLSDVNQGGLSMALRDVEPGLSVRVQRKLTRLRWQVPSAVRA